MRYLILFLFSYSSFACDWSTIKQQGNEFIYSSDCHKAVGKLVQLNDKSEEEIVLLRKSIELKDLALQDSDKRVILWKDESYKQFEILKKAESNKKLENAAWFVAGFASVLLGAWAIQGVAK